MGILLCEQNFRDVWRRNKSVRAEICQILRTHTHAAKLVVEIIIYAGAVCACVCVYVCAYVYVSTCLRMCMRMCVGG